MRLFVLLIAIAMFAGCSSGPSKAAERLRGYKDSYQSCLRANAGDDSKCVPQKKIYDAELEYYKAGHPGSGASPRVRTVCTKVGDNTFCN